MAVFPISFAMDLCKRRRAGGRTGLLESARLRDDPASPARIMIRQGPAAPPPFHDLETSKYRDEVEERMKQAFGSVGECRAAVDEMRRRLGPPLP